MKTLLILAGVAVAGVVAAVVLSGNDDKPSEPRPKPEPKPDPKPHRGPLPPSGKITGYPYTIRHTGGAGPDSNVPVVVVFHGLGGNPEAMADYLEPYLDTPVRLILPRGKNRYGENPAWWLVRAASNDQAKLTAQMEWVAKDIRPFLDAVATAYGRKLIVTGHSQGGMASALVAAYHPELIEKAIAGAPWLPEALWTSRTAPLHAVHGVEDRTIPFARSEIWLEAMARDGAPVTLERVEGGHALNDAVRDAWGSAVEDTAAAA